MLPVHMVLIEGALQIITLVNITRYEFKKRGLLAAWLITTLLAVLFHFLNLYEVFISFGVIFIFIGFLYITTKNITFSILVSIITVIVTLTGNNIAERVMFLFELEPHSLYAQSENTLPIRLVTFTISIVLGRLFRVMLSFIIGRLLKEKLGELTTAPEAGMGRYIVGGAVITLLMFHANIFWVERLERTQMITIISLLLLGYMVFLIAAVHAFVSSINATAEISHQQEMMEHLSNYTSTIEGMYSEMRRFKHDYINILSSIYGHAQEDDNEKLREYLLQELLPYSQEEITTDIQLDRLGSIKLPELKGLLSLKLMQAELIGIKTHIEASLIENINMNTIDMCRVAGILLDNAIEACKGNKGRISFMAMDEEGCVCLIFSNTVETAPNLSDIFKKGFSTKGETRGYGLSNLKTIVDRYSNVSFSTHVEDGELIFKLFIGGSKRAESVYL